jgi:hypothetical protein
MICELNREGFFFFFNIHTYFSFHRYLHLEWLLKVVRNDIKKTLIFNAATNNSNNLIVPD